jgi:Neuraminidase (sialidase)
VGCGASGQQIGADVEPSLAIDPSNADQLIAVWQQDRLATNSAAGATTAMSHDGGRTWFSQPLPGLTLCDAGPCAAATDTWASIGPDGTAYIGAVACAGAGTAADRSAVVMSVSRDGGKQWAHPGVVATAQVSGTSLDKDMILADPHHAGTVYAVWSQVNDLGSMQGATEIDFARSDDYGATWTEPVRMFRGDDTTSQFNQILAPRDGTLVDIFVESPLLSEVSDPPPAPTMLLRAVRSTDGGKTWSSPQTITSFTYTVATDPLSGGTIRATGQDITATSDRQGRLYVGWFEVHPSGQSSIWIATSVDTGTTWSAPIAVIQRSGDEIFLPEVAASDDGRIAVLWYQTQAAAAKRRFDVDVWYAVSSDQGKLWSDMDLDGPFDMSTAPTSSLGPFLGDYEGMVGLPNGFAFAYAKALSVIAGNGLSAIFFARR